MDRLPYLRVWNRQDMVDTSEQLRSLLEKLGPISDPVTQYINVYDLLITIQERVMFDTDYYDPAPHWHFKPCQCKYGRNQPSRSLNCGSIGDPLA